MGMRKPAEWFTITDERILEYLSEVEDPASAASINESGELLAARSTISKRLNRLADAGLLERYPNGVYTITEEGEGYLSGEYDVKSGEWL
jgi:Mn-dependent DtxR family transcriptional regulator